MRELGEEDDSQETIENDGGTSEDITQTQIENENEEEEEENDSGMSRDDQPQPRRSSRIVHKPVYLDDYILMAET